MRPEPCVICGKNEADFNAFFGEFLCPGENPCLEEARNNERINQGQINKPKAIPESNGYA